MNGNTPYAGLPEVTRAGERATADRQPLSSAQRRVLHRDLSLIATRTRKLLPDEYVVDTTVSQGPTGPQATVAVQPPIGHAVSAGFSPDIEEETDAIVDAADRTEVAHGLAASAALQVKQAVGDAVEPTAK